MNVVAFIPARGGSKRVPGKNLRGVNGRSLLSRAIFSAFGAGIEAVVSTDDEAIASAARKCITMRVAGPLPKGVAGYADKVPTIHARPADLATDTARVEDAITHWLTEGHTPDVIVLLQPTSPLRTATHVREALALMRRRHADAVLSVCVSHTHYFVGDLDPRDVGDGDVEYVKWLPLAARVPLRTQDLAPRAHENGAIYAVTREHFERTRSLHGGNSVAYVMDPLDSIDVDTPRDLYLAAIYESVRRDERIHASGPNAAEWWAGMARDGIDT